MDKLPKKIIRGLKIFGILLAILCTIQSVNASITRNLPRSIISDEFPESYQMFIDKLKETYPNATFKAVYTGLDFETVLKHECYEVKSGISLVSSSYSSVWKKDGINIYKDGNFVVASKNAVRYVLDPRNMLYDKYVFQFEGLVYNENITTNVIEKVISSSPMVGTYEKKYKNDGNWVDMDMSYAEIIDRVGKEQGVSSVYIASLMIQETSGDIINNEGINGSNSKYPGVYNFFNIGATPNADGTGSITKGLKYAKNAGWTTPYLSISGGVNNIKRTYIQYGQDTIYFQKFDVSNPYGNASALMAYQYQTNILAPICESIISYNAYKKLGLLDTAFTFYIPVYENMPEDPTPYPAADSAKFVSDNTKVYLDDGIDNGTDSFNIRYSANTELDNIVYILKEKSNDPNNRVLMTRTKKGDGYNFDYVEFYVGEELIKGYVWSEYVKEYEYTKVESISLDKEEIELQIDDTYDLELTITPDNATFKNVKWESLDEEVATVENGKITAVSEGKTVIKVYTLEDANEVECKVTVIPKVQDIILEKTEYIVEVGESVTPQVTLKHIENYSLESENEEIVIIEGQSFKGVSEGETSITVKGENTDITKEIIVVIKKKEDIQIENYTLDESILVSSKTVTGIVPNTSVSDLIAKVTMNNLTILIKDVFGNELSSDDIVGTGSKIIFLKEDNSIFDELEIIIKGDVTGDGVINSADLLKIVKYLNKVVEIDTRASDVTKDNLTNSADLLKIVKYLNKVSDIDFS